MTKIPGIYKIQTNKIKKAEVIVIYLKLKVYLRHKNQITKRMSNEEIHILILSLSNNTKINPKKDAKRSIKSVILLVLKILIL